MNNLIALNDYGFSMLRNMVLILSISDGDMFDKISFDVQSSSEGSFDMKNKKMYEYRSLRKIKEMKK